MPELSLTITRHPDGTVTVNGPLQDKGICYALLECGRDAIKDHHDKQAQSPIMRPPPGALGPAGKPF